jgi:hypothetical protein
LDSHIGARSPTYMVLKVYLQAASFRYKYWTSNLTSTNISFPYVLRCWYHVFTCSAGRANRISITMLLASLLSPWIFLLIPLLYYGLPYISHSKIRDIPGPFPAAFTNLWLMYQCRRGRRSLAVEEAHKRYGPIVRIQPNHVSIADPEAIGIVYGHGNDFFQKRFARPSSQLNTTTQSVYNRSS